MKIISVLALIFSFLHSIIWIVENRLFISSYQNVINLYQPQSTKNIAKLITNSINFKNLKNKRNQKILQYSQYIQKTTQEKGKDMSEEQQKQQTKNNKKPKQNENEKKNTDAWKQKQALKKKQKQEKQKQSTGAVEQKEDKKQKKKKQKNQDNQVKQQGKKQQSGKDKKVQQGVNKKEQKVEEQSKTFKKLQTIETLIVPKFSQLLDNRSAQVDLIQKQILGLIRPGDTIIYIGNFKLHSTGKQLSPGSGRNNFKLIQIPNFYEHPDSQVLCLYEDTPYLISQQASKIFLEGVTIFQNGSCLAPKGHQSISITAKYYNKPLIITSGSWNYSNISISNYKELENIYGQDIINRYDFIQSQLIDFVCMEFGAVLPSQVRYHVEQGYKGYGYEDVKW